MGVGKGHGHEIAWVPLGKWFNLSGPWFPYLKYEGVELGNLNGPFWL